jgi:hypothetical protein
VDLKWQQPDCLPVSAEAEWRVPPARRVSHPDIIFFLWKEKSTPSGSKTRVFCHLSSQLCFDFGEKAVKNLSNHSLNAKIKKDMFI